MSSIEHPRIVHCFNHTTDYKVRMMIGNLVCGLNGADLFVSGDNLWSAISVSASSPTDMNDFIATAVSRDCIDRQDRSKAVSRRTITAAVKSYVLGLELPPTESRNVISTLNMAVTFKKLALNDVVFDEFSNVVGIKGVTVDDRGTVTLTTHPYRR